MRDLIAPKNIERRANNGAKVDDAASTITGDSLIVLHKKFHIPNDVVTMVPKRFDRASLPPPGYLIVCETNLRTGLHFSPPAELIGISKGCGVSLFQFLYRAISMSLQTIIQDRIQEAYDHIYKIEEKTLEQQCIDEGFIQGFLKGVRLVQQKAGVEVEGLTPSQALNDSPLDSDGDEIESELQKAFALEVDVEIVDIK
ncbi:hypothetical protein IEQ34_016848 [Dendrobium chrysotoxum]|uniref:DNA-directed RNA polymerase n=1 Tax=Dendrobium chrysotoxum TaxID=161865 RepID=A0AAV7GGX2_DENCH|nr:hypothetical protein IEQ34_016848 [Dendrobium chrysotoxum]